MTQFDTMEDIIKYAIEKEKEAAEFYEKAAANETFSAAKKLFTEFAKEEKKHQAMLENIEKNEEILKTYKFKWISDMKRSNFMAPIEYSKGMGFDSILHLAMKREEEALDFYNDLMNRSDKESHKKLFKMLCQEEAKHKSALEIMYDDYMAEQGD